MSLPSEIAQEIFRVSRESRNLQRGIRRWWEAHEAQKASFLAHAAADPIIAHQHFPVIADNQQNLMQMSQQEIDLQLKTIGQLRSKLLSAGLPM